MHVICILTLHICTIYITKLYGCDTAQSREGEPMIQLCVLDMLNLHVNIPDADFFYIPIFSSPTSLLSLQLFSFGTYMDSIINLREICQDVFSHWDLLWTIPDDQINPQCLSVFYTIVYTSVWPLLSTKGTTTSWDSSTRGRKVHVKRLFS